jgi:hypothetical protein
MRVAFVACLALALAPYCIAQSGSAVRAGKAVPYIYTMTGDRFVAMLHRAEPLTVLEREKAYSYLDGLKDATHGSVWCDIDQLKTPDLAYDLADEIARAPSAERSKSAASLLLAMLHRKYPCAAPAKGR